MITKPNTKKRSDELVMRLYGQNVSFARWQWEVMLYEDLKPDCSTAQRVRDLLERC